MDRKTPVVPRLILRYSAKNPTVCTYIYAYAMSSDTKATRSREKAAAAGDGRRYDVLR